MDPSAGDSCVTGAVKLSDVLTAEEIQPFITRSNGRAGLMVASNLGLMALAFALPILWLNPVTVVVAMVLLGARQLGMAVINHDCAHGVFFKARWLNVLIGHWVSGGLLDTSMYAYRTYHLKHHRFAGTTDDPDLEMANAYPASRASLKRKLTRDATGQTGWKALKALLGRLHPVSHAPFLISHLTLLLILTLIGAPWAYLMWWASYVFVYQVVTRLRFIGEHGVAIDRLSADARENTCTTLVSWWERLLIAPNYVNFQSRASPERRGSLLSIGEPA